MNVISKKKQGIIAIICAIAMVVTSLTIYNPREAKADTDYSQLTYNYKNKGEAYMKGAENTKSPWRVAVDTSQSSGDIINWMTTGDGNLNFYGEMFMNVTWHGVYPDATLEINGVKVEKGAEGVQVYASAEIHVNAKIWINNDAYNVVKVTSKDETQYITFIVATGNKVDSSIEESTELQAPAAPTGLVANINDLKTNYTIAFANVATATSYKFYLDGTYVKDITNGGVVTIEELKLEAGKAYTFGVSAVNAAGESEISTVSVTVPSKETETTTGSEETTEPFDPATITEWTKVTNSTTMSYYIADGASDKLSVKPEMHGDNLYAAFKLAAKFKSVELNGEAITPRDGADIEIPKTSFKEEYNKLVVTNYYGSESVTIYFKVAKEEETTTEAYVDGAVLINESNVTKEVPAYAGGDYWQNEYNNAPVNYVQGKKYVAEVVVSSTATKKIKMVFQRVGIWDFVDANQGYEAEIEAGNKVKITYVFEATQSSDNGNFDIYLGSVADATTLVFESKKLTTYNEVPEGVKTGVEVLSVPEKTKYTVTVDGTATEVEEGAEYTFGDNAQGYYDTTNKVAYAPGEKIIVNNNITVTSINLNVAMANGASVRLATPTGLRFQTIITSDNNLAISDILNDSKTIATGTLITTYDLFSTNGNKLTKDSGYTKLDIANSGWFNEEIGKFCGSIIKIKKDNYEKKFIGVGYVTITYNNGNTYSVYADVNETNNARSIYYVANAVKDAGYKNCDETQKSIIDKYLAKEEF